MESKCNTLVLNSCRKSLATEERLFGDESKMEVKLEREDSFRGGNGKDVQSQKETGHDELGHDLDCHDVQVHHIQGREVPGRDTDGHQVHDHRARGHDVHAHRDHVDKKQHRQNRSHNDHSHHDHKRYHHIGGPYTHRNQFFRSLMRQLKHDQNQKNS